MGWLKFSSTDVDWDPTTAAPMVEVCVSQSGLDF